MPLDFGPILSGVARPPVLFRGARFRTLATVGGAAVLIALRTGFVFPRHGRALILPCTTAETFCILCHFDHLLSKAISM